MTERECQVVELLRCRWDWLPGPSTWTGAIVSQGGSRGEQATEWFECPRCSGRKIVGNGRAESPCDRCQGAGRVKGDPYTFGGKSSSAVQRERATGESESVKLRRQRDSRELRRLELAALHRDGKIAPGERESWERAKQALYASGSFAELDRALAALEQQSAYDRSAVEVVYGYDSPLRTVGGSLQARADRAVTLLALLMPAVIRVPERAVRRDEQIRVLAEQGLTQAKIAERVGVTQQAVSKTLRKEAA